MHFITKKDVVNNSLTIVTLMYVNSKFDIMVQKCLLILAAVEKVYCTLP